MSASAATLPLSDAKLNANRANAQLSTGPTTEQGKAASSQNATRHGLTGTFKVLASESQAEYDELLAGFLESEQPEGPEEIQIVHQMTEAFWLSRRCMRLENDCFALLLEGTPAEQKAAEKSINLYLRYQAAQQRIFSHCLVEMRKRRTERLRVHRGFVSQQLKTNNDKRRQEAHEVRIRTQELRHHSIETRNRAAIAKAEALELKNLEKLSKLTAAA